MVWATFGRFRQSFRRLLDVFNEVFGVLRIFRGNFGFVAEFFASLGGFVAFLVAFCCFLGYSVRFLVRVRILDQKPTYIAKYYHILPLGLFLSEFFENSIISGRFLNKNTIK